MEQQDSVSVSRWSFLGLLSPTNCLWKCTLSVKLHLCWRGMYRSVSNEPSNRSTHTHTHTSLDFYLCQDFHRYRAAASSFPKTLQPPPELSHHLDTILKNVLTPQKYPHFASWMSLFCYWEHRHTTKKNIFFYLKFALFFYFLNQKNRPPKFDKVCVISTNNIKYDKNRKQRMSWSLVQENKGMSAEERWAFIVSVY